MTELAIFASEKRANALIAEIFRSHLLALPLGHELTQNVMLFGVCFDLLSRQRNIKYLLGSRRKVFQIYRSGTAKTDGPLVAGSCQTEIASGSFRDFGRLIRLLRRVAESSHLALLLLTSAGL